MPEVKLTKNELRAQQNKLSQLKKYLPTLQLKKAMLQLEVADAKVEVAKYEETYKTEYASVENFASLLSEKTAIDPSKAIKIKSVERGYDNIAGVEVPFLRNVVFEDMEYDLVDTPAWVDRALERLKELKVASVKIVVAREKKKALEAELREVSIRVNLFEKILIPRSEVNIKKIKVFLGDMQLAAVAQAKVAKALIEEKKENADRR